MQNMVTLRPGARGTIRLVQEYGDDLLFVRYRYNPREGKRYKTVELVVDTRPWAPCASMSQHLWLHIPEHETALIRRVRLNGGKKSRFDALWRLPLWQVRELELEERVVQPPGKSRRIDATPPDNA